IESTYGDRAHQAVDPAAALAEIAERVAARGGSLIMPAFAVGRAQLILFHLERLKAGGRLRSMPVYLDSPMAQDATELLCRHLEDHKLSPEQCRALSAVAHYVRSAAESKALTADPTPTIVISASGMATAARPSHPPQRPL